MNILNISYSSSAIPQSGGHIRINHYNKAFSTLPDVIIRQCSFQLNPLKRKGVIKHSKTYTEHLFNSWFYSCCLILLIKILKVRRWPVFIPLIFKFIRPSKGFKRMLDWAEVIQVEEIWLVSWISRYTTKPIILVQHNVEYVLIKGLLQNRDKKRIKKLVYNTEKTALTTADYVFCTGEDDRSQMLQLYNVSEEKLKIVPNGILASLYTNKNTLIENTNITENDSWFKDFSKIALFTGSHYKPNLEAADLIINKIAPNLKDVLFIIAGSLFKTASFRDNILITGRLSNEALMKAFHTADIAINPIVTGSGSNIKMFEYMTTALPIVTTECGSRGLSQKEKEAMIICSIEDMPDKIKELLYSPAKMDYYKRCSLNISTYYDFVNIAQRAQPYYKSLLR